MNSILIINKKYYIHNLSTNYDISDRAIVALRIKNAANKKYHAGSKKAYILFKRDDGIYYYDKKDELPSQAILLEKDNNLGIII